ncbi:MAG: hypothetical protein F6K17_10325 [Okeania sp. SIO3C4]|nr:hypothetical protein [Okeania sp. SIO3C4]
MKEEGIKKKEGCKIYQINHISYLLKEEGRKKKEGCKIYQINHVSLSENIWPVPCSLFLITEKFCSKASWHFKGIKK